MYNMRRRFFKENLRRFISDDPIASSSISYPYTANNPINFSDPSGMILISFSDPLIVQMLNRIRIQFTRDNQSADSYSLYELLEIAANEIGYNYQTNSASWDYLFRCYCRLPASSGNVENIVNNSSITNILRAYTWAAARATGTTEIHIGLQQLLPAPISFIKTVLVHELTHIDTCGIPSNPRLQHGCCDFIAHDLGFTNFSPWTAYKINDIEYNNNFYDVLRTVTQEILQNNQSGISYNDLNRFYLEIWGKRTDSLSKYGPTFGNDVPAFWGYPSGNAGWRQMRTQYVRNSGCRRRT